MCGCLKLLEDVECLYAFVIIKKREIGKSFVLMIENRNLGPISTTFCDD